MAEIKTTLIEFPEKTLLTRKEVAQLMSIGLSTLDSCIPDEELPRVRLSKRVLFRKVDVEQYITNHVVTSRNSKQR